MELRIFYLHWYLETQLYEVSMSNLPRFYLKLFHSTLFIRIKRFWETIRKSRFISAMMNYWYYLILITILIYGYKQWNESQHVSGHVHAENCIINLNVTVSANKSCNKCKTFKCLRSRTCAKFIVFFSCQRDLKWCADFASQKRLTVGSTFFNDEFENRNHEISSQTHKRFFVEKY